MNPAIDIHNNYSLPFGQGPMMRMFEKSVDLQCIIGLDGCFKLVNPAFLKHMGGFQSDWENKQWINFIHPEDVTTTIDAERNLINGEDHISFDNRILFSPYKYTWIHWDAYVFSEIDRIYIGRDIEKEKEAEINYKVYKKIIDSSFEGVIIAESKTDKSMPDIIYSNDAFAKIIGYSKEELIGRQPNIMAGAETNLNDLIRIGECLQNEEPGIFELINYKKNGDKFWSHFSLTPIFDEHHTCTHWVSSTKDISEEKRQKNSLIESENKFRNLVQNSSVGIYILMRNKFLFVNHAFAAIMGYSTVEIYAMQQDSLVHPDDKERVNKKIEERLAGREQEEHYEMRIISRIGEIRTLEIHGSRTIHNGAPAIIGTAIDITERNISKEKILQFSRAIEQSEASIVITNLEGTIEYVNPAFCRISGYSKEEAIGQNPRILKTSHTESGTHEKLWNYLSDGVSWKGIFCNQKKNGELYWEQAVISPVINEQGIKTNYVAVKEDITHRIQLEKEKEKLIEELSISLNELKQFSYITSHNLRAPLTNLLGIIDLLDTSTIQDETTLGLIAGFKRSTIKLNDTLQDLIKSLLLKDNQGMEFSRTNFADIFDKIKLNLGHIIRTHKTIIETNFGHAPEGMFIPAFMESIFQNMITNSIKYAQPGMPAKIEIITEKMGNKILLSFTDNGLGMDLDKVRDKLFGLYQKFHKNDDSKGIGLYLVKSHVHAMKGEIEVFSEPNKGTKFLMTFEQ